MSGLIRDSFPLREQRSKAVRALLGDILCPCVCPARHFRPTTRLPKNGPTTWPTTRLQLNKYCEELENIAMSFGYLPTVEKRGRSGPVWLHMKWVVRYRVQK